MMLLSYKKIEEHKEEINKINVFPVPDQDTGSNMAKTLLGIKEAVENKDFKDLNEFSEAVLDGALTAAQGNAGVIYTGFLAGFLPLLNKNPVDAKKLAIAFKKGAERAKQSIQNPKEGTILDVIGAATESIREGAEGETDIITILKKSIEKAKVALLATREKMEVLRKANVVDAGGLGFLMILEGHLESLEGEKPKEKKEAEPSKKVRRFVQVLSNRFEVVSLIKNPKFPEKEIRQKLKNLGNCLDIVQVGERVKIHIHTDFPDDVTNIMRGLGQIQSLRIEDMAKEVAGEKSVRKVSVGIITDELADLTKKIIERYQIEVVPYKIDWPEGENLPGENIYQKMEEAEKRGIKSSPKTSQAPPGEFLEVYQKQLEKPSTRAKLGAGLVPHRNEVSGAGFQKVLCIVLSSKLSGGYNSACQAKEILPEEQKNKVYVFDSLQASAGQALLVLRAIELIQEHREIDEIIPELKKTIPNIYLYGFIANPKWLERGGRASPRLANWIRKFQKIGLYPFIGLKQGEIKPMGIVRAKDLSEGLFKQIEKDSKKIRKKGKKIRVVITHCDNLEDAKKLKEMVKEIKAEVSFTNLTGSVIGAHVGPGSLIAAWCPL